jgi:uncharacterized protein (TIGR03067 family)
MRLGIVLILAASVSVPGTGRAQDAGTKDDDQAKKDLASLQGSWVIVAREYMGKKATEEEVEHLKGEMVIKDNTVTQWAEEQGKKEVISTSTFRLDAKARPKAVDVTRTTGDLKGRTTLGIYELDGDSLKVCYSFQGEKRPTEFATKADRKSFLLVYKRVKK